ncbi:type I-F CRISPR-associated protein Csy1, partial [Shigella sp. FC1967]|uniref:type I-F CRISPR-associated protein Csy1 n=1 Tax=Shigella sp. FC1967 TaxID=1898041 RepID=UPI002570E2AA
NYKLREKFEWYVEQYIDHIIFMMWKVRDEFSKNDYLVRISFFDTLNPWVLKDLFNQISSFFNNKQNNYKLREKFEWYVEQYIDHIIFMMWKVRDEFSKNNEVRPQELPEYQKIWLFPENKKIRNEENAWLLKLINAIAQKFIYDYQKVANKEAITLGDGELERIIAIIRQNKDELK